MLCFGISRRFHLHALVALSLSLHRAVDGEPNALDAILLGVLEGSFRWGAILIDV